MLQGVLQQHAQRVTDGVFHTGTARFSAQASDLKHVGNLKIGMVGEVMGNDVKRDRRRAHLELFSSRNGGIICAVVKLCLSYS